MGFASRSTFCFTVVSDVLFESVDNLL